MQALRGKDAPSGQMVAGPDGLNDQLGWTVFNLGGGALAGQQVSQRTAMSLPSVLRAAEILTGVFAMTPLIYYRRLPDGGRERAANNPLYKLFHSRPNGVQNPFQFKELLLGDMIFAGGFYAFVHRDEGYRPRALSRLDPAGAVISQAWDKADGLELFYDVMLPNGSRERLTRADIWHVPGFSRDGLTGFDRIRLMNTALSGAVATAEYARSFWENNAQPSTVVMAKGRVDPEQKALIRQDWINRFRGARKGGDVAVLDQDLDVKMLSHDHKASQHIETRTFYVIEVARAFGVPPHLLFELGRATFSNIEQQSLEFITYHMMPHYERVANAATFYFAEPGHYFEFLPDALLKGDIKSRFEAYSIAIDKGIFSPNEVREMENRNKRPGGDEYRIGSGSMLEGQEPGKTEREES